MKEPDNYDEAVNYAEEIVKRLETTEALSLNDYKQMANEVKRLLDYAENCLRNMDYSVDKQ